MRKEKQTYYFSVEGETEKWYLDWLQNTINSIPDVKYAVKLDSRIQKDPVSYAKRLNAISRTEVTHIFDFESEEPIHVQQFKTTLDRMKQAQSIGKNIKYNLGYSNFTFELWIILHMTDCNGQKSHRRQYLEHINRAYTEHFETLDEYKHEDNFKRILSKLKIENVIQAVTRAKAIMDHNRDVDYVLQEYKGYKYYRENPSLSIWESVEKILEKCGLL